MAKKKKAVPKRRRPTTIKKKMRRAALKKKINPRKGAPPAKISQNGVDPVADEAKAFEPQGPTVDDQPAEPAPEVIAEEVKDPEEL